jgi:hypothetical protein
MYIPATESQLAAAAAEYTAATQNQKAAFERWCLEQPNGAAPFNDHSWLTWRKATYATTALLRPHSPPTPPQASSRGYRAGTALLRHHGPAAGATGASRNRAGGWVGGAIAWWAGPGVGGLGAGDRVARDR